jgi:predicted  nucleic acid-binding Zn-ribbon protein
MTQSQDPNDKSHEIDRKLRSLDRRVDRLEDTQITGRELNRGFDRVYEEIDDLDDKIDDLDDKVDHLRVEFTDFREEINQKLDTILRHLTGIDRSQ